MAKKYWMLVVLLIQGMGSYGFAATDEELKDAQAEIARLRGALAVAESKLNQLQTGPAAETLEGKAVLESSGKEVEKKNSWVWSYAIRLPISFGYESNPTGLSDDLPRALGLAHKGSSVIRINPSLKVTLETSPTVTWLFRYDLLHDFYNQRADINTDNHTFIIGRKQAFNDGQDTLNFTLRDDLLRVDEEGNANQFSTGPEWEHFWDKQIDSTILKYSFNINDFALSDNRKIDPVSDPDSKVHVLGLAQKRVMRQKDETIADDKAFSISLGLEHSWQDADGNDLDRQRNRLTLDTDGRPFPKSFGVFQPIGLELHYRHDFDDYDDRNSKAGPGGFEFDRSDNIDDFTAILSYPLNTGAKWKQIEKPIKSSVFVNYHYDRRDSNIFGQDKDNHAIRVGVIGDF
jgi:hypothetical protein